MIRFTSVGLFLALQQFAVAQPGCYTAPVTAISIPAASRTSTFLIYKQPACAWFLPPAGNVISNAAWITIPADNWWGYGNAGAFAFDAAANAGVARVGTITAAGITFTVRQFGAADTMPVTGTAVTALASLDSTMANAMKEFGVPGGALAVTYQGRLVYARGFGYADLESLELAQPDSMFRLASVSKLMTMAAISKLESQSLIAPTSKALTILNNFLPPPALSVTDLRWYDITVDQLINHTGGFLRATLDRALDYNYLVGATTALGQTMPGDNTSAIRWAMSKPLDYTPGAPPNPCPDCYSNFGYQILGRIVEKTTGSTYENYVRNTLMTPAGVSRTRAAKSFAAQIAPGEVKYYVNSSEMWGNSVFAATPGPALFTYGSYPYENMDSFGGMISNTMDLLRFYNFWLNWGPGSGFFGSLPGTNTGVFTLSANNSVRYSFLFNYRSNHSRTNTGICTAASSCDLENAVRSDLETALAAIAGWPAGDQFPTYSGSTPLCSFTQSPSSFSVDSAARGASVSVTASNASCSWTGVSDVQWVTVSGTPGTGSAALNLTISANASFSPRTTTVYGAGLPVAVTQSGNGNLVVNQGSGQSAIINTAFGLALQAKVTDGIGNPVSGVTVTFAAPSSLASVTFPSGNTGLTNGSGLASVAITANSVPGSYTVTASAPGVAPVANFPLTNLSATNGISGQASGATAVTITVSGAQSISTVTNASGNYSFPSLTSGGTFTVTPSLAGYKFAPSSLTFTNLSSNQTANFTAIVVQREKVGAFYSDYGNWVEDANGNFAWDGTSVDRLIHWSLGQTGEVPVIGDWNGDGKSKVGLYINGTWYLDFNGNGVWDGPNVDKLVYFGGPGFAPYVGDWNGSGTSKMAVHKDGTWMIDFNGNFAWDGPGVDKLIFFGGPGYTPVVGDWNGSGSAKIGAHLNGLWILDYNGNLAWDGVSVDKLLFFGGPGYRPMMGDWNGSGSTKIGAHLNGLWILDYNGNLAWDGTGVDKLIFFGGPEYTAMVGDWNGSGSSKVGAYVNGVWLLDVNGNFVWDPPVDQVIFFGGPGQTPVVGKW